MPPPQLNKNLRVLKEGIKKNRSHIQRLNIAFNERLQQQQQNINNFKNAIGDDNRQKDQKISEINHNLALLKSFVTEKLSNHPNHYVNFVNHLSSQPINNSIAPIGGPSIQGGRRKTRKRKNKKKRTKRVKIKRKTRRKKGARRPERSSTRVYPRPTENENITYIEPNRRGRETLWREHKVNIRDLPRARVVRTRELPLAQEVVVGKVRETPRQHLISLAKKCKNKFDSACRTVKRMTRRELSGSGRRKRKTRRRRKRKNK